MSGCWFTSLVWLLTVGWLVVELSGNLVELLYNKPSLIVTCCFSAPLCCRCLIVLMNCFCKHSSCYHSSAPLILINSLSLNTCCYDYWLRIVTTSITLASTLLVLDGLGVIMALKLIGLVLNMFCTSIFLGAFSIFMFYVKTNYTRIMASIFLNLTSWFFFLAIGSIDLIVSLGTISTYLFLLWQVSTKWPVLPQLVQVNVDLIVTLSTTCLITALASHVVSRIL